MLDERSASMLAYLQEKQDYVSVRELMGAFHISKRTVYYDMDKIDGWLRFNGMAPVERVRGAGFRLPEETRSQLPAKAGNARVSQYYLSRDERVAWLGLHLIHRTKPMFLHDMEQLLRVSRGTVLATLQQLRTELAAFGLDIAFHRKDGYEVRGNEKDKRTALSHMLSALLTHMSWKQFVSRMRGLVGANLYRSHFPHLGEDRLSSVYDMIASGERAIGMELADETIVHLAALLLLSADRLAQGKRVTMDEEEKRALRKTPQFQAAVKIAQELEKLFGVPFPEDEICYMTVHLLAAKVNRLERESDDQETVRLREATGRMIDMFERLGCVYFQHREALEKQLFLHVKSAYYRIKYNLKTENPLTASIMEKYPEVFELTKKSALPLEELLGKPIGDDELAYMAMHFGGWLRREQVKPVRRKSAAIVCVNGVSASRMLKIQLEQLFPAIDITAVLSLRDYEHFTGKVDFIFSTVPLPNSEVPVFTVNAIMSDAEKASLLNRLLPHLDGGAGEGPGPSAQAIVELVKKHAVVRNEGRLLEDVRRYLAAARGGRVEDRKPSLKELLTPDRMTLQGEAEDWRAAIRLAAEPLLNDGSIVRRYVQAMIDKVERHGPYIVIGPGIAIAHARPEDGVVRSAMALLTSARGIDFGSEPRHRVRLLFVIASVDGESHLRALAQLTELFREERHRERLAQATAPDPIVRIIEQYSASV